MQLAIIAGSPGILFEECFGGEDDIKLLHRRSKLIDTEWRNGILALSSDQASRHDHGYPFPVGREVT